MTQEHPITPPRELVREWAKTCSPYEVPADHIATQAARWGADQELQACCEWLVHNYNYPKAGNPLRVARRPEPPSLNPEKSAEVALNLLDDVSGRLDAAHENGIRRALERLRELEDSNTKLPTPVATEPPTKIVFEGTRYTRADLVSSGDKDWGKHVVISGVEYFPL